MQETKDSKLLIAFVGAMVIIFGLILWIIFRKPQVIIESSNKTKELRDSITKLSDQINDDKVYTIRSKEITDSLLSLPPKLTIIYREQKKIVTTASLTQLDSILRANSGLPHR